MNILHNKKNYDTIYITCVHACKVYNKILADQIQQCIKSVIHHDQVEFILEMQG